MSHTSVLLGNVLQRDPLIARQLFSSLCSGILRESGERRTSAEGRSATQKLLQDFTCFLDTSFSFFPPFVSCIQVRLWHARVSVALLVSQMQYQFNTAAGLWWSHLLPGARCSLFILFGCAGSSLLCGPFSSCVGGGCRGHRGLLFVVEQGLPIAMASLV